MSKINTGGAAFPVFQLEVGGEVIQEGSAGLTMRDYFAAKAMIPFIEWALGQDIYPDYDTAEKAASRYAKSAYLIADAMIKARGEQ